MEEKVNIDIWCARVLMVVGCIPLQCIADFSNIPLWSLQESCELEGWLEQRNRWHSLKQREQDNSNIQSLVFGIPKTSKHKEFLDETIKNSREKDSKKSHKIISQMTNRLVEFGMTQQEATQIVDKVRYAQSTIEVGINSLGLEYQDNIPKQSYANLSKYYHRRLAECEEVAWDLVKLLHKQIKDCEEADFSEEVLRRQRAIAYLSGATSRAITGLLELSGAKSYLNSQGAIAKVYAAGLEVVHPSKDVLPN